MCVAACLCVRSFVCLFVCNRSFNRAVVCLLVGLCARVVVCVIVRVCVPVYVCVRSSVCLFV